jgi:hypothetical protein
MYGHSLLKLSIVLWQYYGQKKFLYQFLNILDQISILLLLLYGNSEKKVLIVPRRKFNFSSISRKWTIMEHMCLVVIIL